MRGAPTRSVTRTQVSETEVAALLEVQFPTAMRGYDRDEVDRYVQRVNQVLAELQITKTPELAVQRALDGVEEEKHAVMEEAHQAAEEITARSRSRADDRAEEAAAEAEEVRDAAARDARDTREVAEREAQRIREAAEQRVRELEAEVEEMIERRDQVIHELRDLSGSLDDVVEEKGSDVASSPPAPVDADAAKP
jgi:DivIVA domain-containing protein